MIRFCLQARNYVVPVLNAWMLLSSPFSRNCVIFSNASFVTLDSPMTSFRKTSKSFSGSTEPDALDSDFRFFSFFA